MKDWFRPTIQGAIALIATSGLTAGFFMGLIDAQAYVGVIAVAITWWFKTKEAEIKSQGK